MCRQTSLVQLRQAEAYKVSKEFTLYDMAKMKADPINYSNSGVLAVDFTHPKEKKRVNKRVIVPAGNVARQQPDM